MRGREGVVDVDVAERARACATKAGSFFSSSVWKRVFSRQQNVAGLHRVDRGLGLLADAVLGERDRPPEHLGDRGRDRLERLASGRAPSAGRNATSRITLPPLSAISRMVGATRSMRVASVTLPFSIGTLRSTRTSTRLPLTSA